MKSEQELQSRSYALGFNQRMAKYRIAMLREICHGESLLDVGCGPGEITLGLADRFQRVVGIDLTAEYLDEARSMNTYPHVKFVESAIENFSSIEKFDVILAVDILEHVEDPVLVLKSFRSCLRPGGKVVVVVPNALSVHRQLGVKMGMLATPYELQAHDFEVGHRRYYDRPLLNQHLSDSGWNVVGSAGILYKPLANTQMIGLPESYVDACFELGRQVPDECAELVAVAA